VTHVNVSDVLNQRAAVTVPEVLKLTPFLLDTNVHILSLYNISVNYTENWQCDLR